MMHLWKGLFFILLMGVGMMAQAQAPPRVEVALDLLEAFSSAQVRDSSSCEVRRPGVAGGVRENGLFEHPLAPDRPAQAEYQADLPQVKPGERLLLAFDIAIADGVPFGQAGVVADGVGFIVAVEGKKLFQQDWRECRWQPFAVDLTSYAGQHISLTLIADALQNTSYDWAMWGNPRVLHLQGAPLQARQSPVAAGVLALTYHPGKDLKVRLRPIGGERSLEWKEVPSSHPAERVQWTALDFNFPDAKAVAVEWEPPDALDRVWLAAYPPRPVLVQVSAERAVPFAGETLPLRVEIRNEGRGKLEAGAARVALKAGVQSLGARSLPALAPGKTWRGEWKWEAPERPGRQEIEASLKMQGEERAWTKSHTVEVFLPPKAGRIRVLENKSLRLEFVRADQGYAYARILTRRKGQWRPVGVWRPLMRAVLDTSQGEKDWEIRPRGVSAIQDQKAHALEFTQRVHDPDGVEWTCLLRVVLDPDRPLARLHYEWKTDRDQRIKALWGPNLYVGDGTFGDAKSWGLFPGLEYLYQGERSSNPRDFAPPLDDRRTPHPYKITVPLMAVSVGPGSQPLPPQYGRFFCPDSLKDMSPSGHLTRAQEEPVTVALLWDPHQKWDGEHAFPSARFSAPNLDEGMRNHRMGLFLPSVPDFVPENADRAGKPYPLKAGGSLTLDARLVVRSGPVMVAFKEWSQEVGGIPQPNPWPRSFEEELAVCRAGLLKTVWDEKAQKWSHCIGWEPHHAPGMAALLWMDAHITRSLEGRQQAMERVELAARNMLRDGGTGILTSSANCHIMRWEFPFLYGYLPEALSSLEPTIRGLIQSQQAEGGWRFQPGSDQQSDLGQAGDSVLGTNTANAMTLLRYARITGDRDALQAGEKALSFMERFRVPRGGQTWECPMYEPDILPAGWAIAACLEGYWATGNPRWLHNAIYWAETGLPFIYLWALPDRPMMLGAAIPVFGSTFYSHSWLAMPVQWCGLVYACHLFRLAEALERAGLPKTASPLPLALSLSPKDWKQVVELITVSGMYQQFGEGERIGAYPDSISDFQRRNPAFLNPEDILINVLALKGYDPDIKTVHVHTNEGNVLISSGARIDSAQATTSGVRFNLSFFQGEPSHTLVVGSHPQEVRVSGKLLPGSEKPLGREAGWWWDGERNRLYLVVPHEKEKMEVEIVRE